LDLGKSKAIKPGALGFTAIVGGGAGWGDAVESFDSRIMLKNE